MSSTDGVNRTPRLPADLSASSVPAGETNKLQKSAEEYVAIENRLAAQRGKPSETAQFSSIFDQLRDRLADRRS